MGSIFSWLTGSGHKKYNVRSKAIGRLTESQVKTMIRRHGFYCADQPGGGLVYANPSGLGIKNDFIVESDGWIVRDKATGLRWERGGNNNLTFAEAAAWVTKLNRDRFRNLAAWRLPTLEEAMSLLRPGVNNYSDPVFDEGMLTTWTADRVSDEKAWALYFDNCYPIPYDVDGLQGVRAVSDV